MQAGGAQTAPCLPRWLREDQRGCEGGSLGTPGWLGVTPTGCQPAPQATVPALLPADRLLSLMLLAFEGLNSAVSKDRCLACLEEPFFSPLWPLLLALYRCRPAPPLYAW